MSDKLPVVRPVQLIKVLQRKGWQLERVRGSHYIMKDSEMRRVVPIPMHSKELKTGTLVAIMRSVGISREDLQDML